MLATSRLYSFLDHQKGFNVHFLEGQKLIYDLALMHPMHRSGFAYFRDTFLGLLPVIFFLKPGESLGIYIDSEDPYFRMKIETNSAGHTRTLLLPLEFNQFPMRIDGNVRVTKLFPSQSGQPYTSVLELRGVESKEVMNQILSQSYQTNSEVIIADVSDQAVMVTQLPKLNVNSSLEEIGTRQDYINKNKFFFQTVFEAATDDIEKIVKMFEDNGLSYLGSKQVSFFCPCSEERMILNLKGLYRGDLDELFQDGETVEVDCDYCRKKYHISKSSVINS